MSLVAKVLTVEKRKSKKGKGVYYISTVQLEDGSEASGIGLYNVGEHVKSWFDEQYNKSKIAKG